MAKEGKKSDFIDVTKPQSVKNILAYLTTKSEDIINQSLHFAEQLYNQERERRISAESKALNLTGLIGITTALVVALINFLFIDLGKSNIEVQSLLGIVDVRVLGIEATFFMLGIIFFFILAVYFAYETIKVGEESLADPNQIFELQSNKPLEFKKEYAASLLSAYSQNVKINNRKVGYLASAQFSFLAGVLILLLFTILSILVGLGILFNTISQGLIFTAILAVIWFVVISILRRKGYI